MSERATLNSCIVGPAPLNAKRTQPGLMWLGSEIRKFDTVTGTTRVTCAAALEFEAQPAVANAAVSTTAVRPSAIRDAAVPRASATRRAFTPRCIGGPSA